LFDEIKINQNKLFALVEGDEPQQNLSEDKSPKNSS